VSTETILLALLTTVLTILGAVLVAYLKNLRADQRKVVDQVACFAVDLGTVKGELVDRIHGVELRAAQTYVTKSEHLIDFSAMDRLLTEKLSEITSALEGCREETS
jgi:hypothetical protein